MCSFETNNIIAMGKHVSEKHKFKCDKCYFSTDTNLQLSMRKEAHHGTHSSNEETSRIVCENCDFVAKSSIQLDKHKVVCHGRRGNGPKSRVCWFWQDGHCARPFCKFERSAPQHGSDRRISVPCRYGDFCRNSFCMFNHSGSFLGRRPNMGFWH